MKTMAILLAAIILLVSLPRAAMSQDPVVDLAITDLIYTPLSGDSALFEAEVQLATRDSINTIVTYVDFDIDGQPAGSVMYDVTPTPSSPCQESGPPCDRVCLPAEINGEIVEGWCGSIIWGEIPREDCVCFYLVQKPRIEPIPPDPQYLTATVDQANAIDEMDETNNSMTIFIGPTARGHSSWGTIKSLYR